MLGRQLLSTISHHNTSKDNVVSLLNDLLSISLDHKTRYSIKRLIEDYTHLNEYFSPDESVLLNSNKRNKLVKGVLNQVVCVTPEQTIAKEVVLKNIKITENHVPESFLDTIKFALKRSIRTDV